jgi:integrase
MTREPLGCKTSQLTTVEGVTPHVLKHTSITWLVQAGHQFEWIAKLSSTSRDVIEKVYGHHSPQFLNSVGRDLSF